MWLMRWRLAVIKAAWERLCWESIFPCVEYSIIL
jgi:hypothetical protein